MIGKVVVAPKLIKFLEKFAPIRIRAIALFPFIIFRAKDRINPVIVNHERIHFAQQLELLIIPFYILYLIEYAFKGYRNISFEKEAYENQNNPYYLKNRKFLSFLKYF